MLLEEPRAAAQNKGKAAVRYRVVLRNALTGDPIRLPFVVARRGLAAFAPQGHRVYLARAKQLFALADTGVPQTVLEADARFEKLTRTRHGGLLAKAGSKRWLLTRAGKRFQKLELPDAAKLLGIAKGGRRVLFQLAPEQAADGSDGNGSLVTLGWKEGRRTLHFTLPGKPAKTAFADDGAVAAFVTYDAADRAAPQLMPNYLSREVTVKKVRSRRTGDGARLCRVHLARFQKQAELDLLPLVPGKRPAAVPVRIETLAFDPKGKRLLIQTVDAAWQRRQILLCDRGRPKTVELLHEEIDDRWLGPLARFAAFDAEAKGVVFTSEVADKARLFTRSLSPGAAPEPLTPEDVLIESCVRAPDGRFVVGMAREGPARRFLAIVDAGRKEVVHPDQPPGWNERPVLAPGAGRMIFLHSRLFRPPEVWTSPLARVGKSRQLTRLTDRSFLDYRWIRPQPVSYHGKDKTRIHAHLFMPKAQRPADGWPAVIFLHGSGYLQNVTDSMTAYPKNLLFHHRLAERGYVVLAPDFRGSRGYGREFRTAVHKDLGGIDRLDIVAARRFLFDRCGVNLAKIGVYGGSYGGFLTLMCLFKEPKAFACGAALRPVTDWLRYHPRYTHPRLGSPKEPGGVEVYRRTSPIWFAEALERPLLLLHGMQDSNVFVQDTVRLIERLIQHGKDFDAMLYPSQPHAFDDPAAWIDEYRRIERLFDRTLR